MDWDSITSALGDKLKKSDDLNKATTADMVDRVQMGANPDAQGPPLPAQTVDEKAQSAAMPQAMVGAVAPGASAAYPMLSKAVGEAAEPITQGFQSLASNPADVAGAKALVQKVADAGYNTYHPIAQKAQALLGRAMTYARGSQ